MIKEQANNTPPGSSIVLLRGVNVGGNRSFRPSVVAEQLKDLDVANIGAAGTFVVHKPLPEKELRYAFLNCLPFQTEIIIFSQEEFQRLRSANPHQGQDTHTGTTRFVSFLAELPPSPPLLPLYLPDPQAPLLHIQELQERFVFGTYQRNTKAINLLGRLDRLFGCTATTRNWNTVTAILKVLENGE